MLGGYLEFFMEPSLAETYLNLRKHLDELFQCKLLNPKLDLHTHHDLFLLLPEDQATGRFVFNRQVLYENSKPYIAAVPPPPPPPSRIESGPGGDNPKSQLQTLLTRAGYPAPIYRTNQLPNNQFRSVCEFNGVQITGHAFHNKKQAEKDAAAEAIDHLIGGTHASMLKKSKTNHN